MRTSNPPSKDNITLSQVLFALSDPVRLSIVKSIATQGEQTCGAFNLPVAKSTATHHFRVLRDAGIIQTQIEGAQHINSLRREDLDGRFPGLLDAVLQASGQVRASSLTS